MTCLLGIKKASEVFDATKIKTTFIVLDAIDEVKASHCNVTHLYSTKNFEASNVS